MLQSGQNLSLCAKPLEQDCAVGAAPDGLHCHPLFVRCIRANRFVHHAHAALSDAARHVERPKAPTNQRRSGELDLLGAQHARCRRLETVSDMIRRRHQPLNVRANVAVHSRVCQQ